MTKYLVFGARDGSLGAAITDQLRSLDFEVVTAGITKEDQRVDIINDDAVNRLLRITKPENIVCTVGVNHPCPLDHEHWIDAFQEHMLINTYGPLSLLQKWLPISRQFGHFVAISSNSAHIARTNSSAYCMSKAALSMGIRCAAREIARYVNPGPTVYAWEFGLLYDTPMTRETGALLAGDVPSRMEGLPYGIPVADAAEAVVGTLTLVGNGLNGTLIRMDHGEQ